MYARTRRKKRTESMEATAGEREADEEDDDNDSQLLRERQQPPPPHRRDLSTATANPSTSAPLFTLAGNELLNIIVVSNIIRDKINIDLILPFSLLSRILTIVFICLSLIVLNPIGG